MSSVGNSENMHIVHLIFIFILGKSLILGDMFNFQLISSFLLSIIVLTVTKLYHVITETLLDTLKFIGHSLYLSLTISLVLSTIQFIYNIIFYYGFINTIIFVNIITMILMGGAIDSFTTYIYENLSKSAIGRKILQFMNNYYNLYISIKDYLLRLRSFLFHLINKYCWLFAKFGYTQFSAVNKNLSDNIKSRKVKDSIISKYNDSQKLFVKNFVEPAIMKNFQKTLKNSPFSEFILNSNNKNTFHDLNIKKQENNIIIPEMNINEDVIDDLDNELDDEKTINNYNSSNLTNINVNSNNKLEYSSNKSDNPINEVNNTDNKSENGNNEPIEKKRETVSIDKNELRKRLHNKIMSRRTERNGAMMGKKRIEMAQNNLMNMMQQPGMDKAIENLLSGNNIDKLMKEIPADQLSKIPGINANQMKKIIGNLTNKKKN